MNQVNNHIEYFIRNDSAEQFRCKLGFKQHDIMMIKEQSMVTKVIKAFLREEISLQHSISSGDIIDIYLPKHKLAIKVDEFSYCDINKTEQD